MLTPSQNPQDRVSKSVSRKNRQRHRLKLEHLEDRLVLAASPLVVDLEAIAPNLPHEAKLRVLPVGRTTQVQVVNALGTVLAQRALTDVSEVRIAGGPKDDTLTIDFSTPFSLPVRFDGGDGKDSLQITGSSITSTGLTVTDRDAGSFETKSATATALTTFTGIESIRDSSAGAKSVKGTENADIVEARDAGSVNDNSFEIAFDAGLVITYASASTITSLKIDTSAGSDTIDLGLLDSQFTGAVALEAGTGDDEITISGKTGPGSYSIDGGGNLDLLRIGRDADMTLTATQLNAGGLIFGISGFEAASLTGGVSGNLLDASAFPGNVSIYGGAGNDILRGGPGSDFLEGGTGDDALTGNGGDDVYRFALAAGLDLGQDTLAETFAGGRDRLDFRNSAAAISIDLAVTGPQTVADFAGAKLVVSLSAGDTFEDVEGGNGDDIIYGNAAGNALSGRGGNDTIDGRAGADTVHGDAGDDTLTGGLGTDVIAGGTNFDTIVEERDADMTLTDPTLIIGAESDTISEIEKAVLTGGDGANVIDASGFSGPVVLDGRGGNDILKGGTNSDTFTGGSGDDLLIGGFGGDTYAFDADSSLGTDTVIEGFGGGSDLLDFSQTDHAIFVNLGDDNLQAVNSNLKLILPSSIHVENVTGGSGRDTILGNSNNNVIDGGPGVDTVLGLGGFDVFVFSSDGADFTLDNPERLEIEATDSDDDLVLENFDIGSDVLRLRSINGTMSPIEFHGGDGVVIKTKGGKDRIVVESLSPDFRGPLIIDAGGDLLIDSPIVTGGRGLGLKAAGKLQIVANIFTGGGDLLLDAGKSIDIGREYSDNSPPRWLNSHIYKGLEPKSTTGSGSGMKVDVEVNTFGVVTVSIIDPGTGYFPGDKIVIADPQAGIKGDDLVITLGTIAPVTISTRNTSVTTGVSVGDSGDIRFQADHILVGPGSKLIADSTRGTSFAAGDIAMSVDEVAGFDLQGIANVDASMVAISLVGAELRGGHVTLDALANNTRVFFDDDTLTTPEFVAETVAGVVEGLAALIGGVAISRASAVITIDPATKIVATSVDANAAALTSATSSPIGLAVGVAIGIAESTAEVIVAGDITTTGDASFQARTDNTLDVRGDASAIVEFAAGIAVSVLNSSALVDIRESAMLNVGGDLRIQADDFDRNYTAARSNSGRDGSIAAAVAVSVENGKTIARLDGSANVGGDILVNALQQKGQILGSKLAVVPAYYTGVHAAAGVNTDATGDLLDDSMSAVVGTFIVGPLKRFFINPFVDAVKRALEMPAVSDALPFDVGAGIAVVVDNNFVEARIGDGANRVDPAGDDFVKSDGSIEVHARTSNVPDITAKSLMQNPPTVSGPRESLPKKTKFGGSVALASGTYNDTARAYVNDGAVVNAAGALSIRSETLNEIAAGLQDTFAQSPVPDFVSTDGVRTLHIGDIVSVADDHTAGGDPGKWYRYRGIDGVSKNLSQENYADLNRWDFLGMAEVFAAKSVIADVTNALANSFGVEKLFNSWSQATAASDKVAVAGAATVLVVDHESSAYIGAGATINQAPRFAQAEGIQHVSVEASSTNQGIHFGGNLALPGFNLSLANNSLTLDKPGAGARAGDTGVGASFLVINDVNAVSAVIADKARVHADSLKVAASNDVVAATLNASGSDASKRGFAGTFAFDSVDNRTLAQIDDGAIVTVGSAVVPGSDGESLVVEALDRTIVVNAVGGVGLGANVGAGASIGANLVRRDTQAVIGYATGDPADSHSLTGSITVAGPARVEAVNGGFVGTFSLAAAVARDSAKNPLGNDSVKLDFVDGNFIVSGGPALSGASISGDVALNIVDDHAIAAVSGMTGTFGAVLDIAATNDSIIALFAGAAAVTLSGGESSFGIAGAFASNAVISETKAFVSDSDLTSVGSLELQALQSDRVFSVTAGGAGAMRSSGIAAAGSVSVNVVLSDTLAFVQDARIDMHGDAAIEARDESAIWAGAGALALGGKAGVGVALSLNLIGFSTDTAIVPNRPGRTQAFVENSRLRFTSGGLSLLATADDPAADPRIISASASAGASTGGQGNIGGAGTVSVNVIKTVTEAFVTDSIVTGPDSVNIHAVDASGIVTVSGAVGVSQKVSFGAAFGYAEVANTTRAYLDNVDLTTSGALDVNAESKSVIGAATVGVAVGTGSSKLAAAGSASVNLITNTIDAHISDKVTADDAIDTSTISTGGDVSVSARDSSLIVSISGGASVASKGVAVGAAVGYDLIENAVLASIEDVTLDAVGPASSIEVSAESSATLVAVALGVGAGAGNFALGGSVAVNAIANSVDAHIANSPHVAAGDDVSVLAATSDTLISVAGGFAATKDAAVGAAISYTYIGGKFDVANPHAIDKNPANANRVSASIRNTPVIAGDDVIVSASDAQPTGNVPDNFDVFGAAVELPEEAKARIVTVTVGGAGAQNFALGGSVSAQVVAQTVNASIEGTQPVRAGGDVAISSTDKLDLTSISGGVAFGKAAIGAVVSTQVTKNQVNAAIGANADVRAGGNVSVLADRGMEIVPIAGAVGGASQVGIGGAIVTLVQRDSTVAAIGNDAKVTAVGSGASVSFPDQAQSEDGRRMSRPAFGVLVGATTFVDILGISLAGGLAGNVGLAGSAIGTDLSSTTSATIGTRALINQPSPNDPPMTPQLQNVRVFAADDTRIRSSAGALGVSGTVGVGVATDIELITKSTRAAIGTGAKVNAAEDVSVEAYSSEDLLSIVASVAGAGKVAVAGSIAVARLNLATTAEIGDSAIVTAQGNVIVAADDTTELTQAAGGISGAIVGAGATVATVVLDRQTNARIGNSAQVDAKAQRDAVMAPTGTIVESFAARPADDPVAVPAISQPEATDRSLWDSRKASAERKAIKGVAVSATSFDRHTLVGVSAGGGAVDVRGVGVVESATSTTQATIGDNADINLNRDGAGADQSVLVAALADYQNLGIGGTLSGGGVAATPGAEVLVLKLNTIARTGTNAEVSASRDVAVIATASEDLASIATTIAAGGAAFAGAAATIDLTNETTASLGSGSATHASNVAVQASDSTDLDIVAGSAAVGVGSTGVGGSVSIVNVRKRTTALVGDGASVDATGSVQGPVPGLDSEIAYDDQGNAVVTSQAISGLVVQAISGESILSIAASGSGGAFGGLAGVVNFANVDADTFATIGANAQINQNLPGSADQSVHVVALDRVRMLSIAGALSAGSIGGLSGGVDVGLIRNDTAAHIGDGAKVNAEKDVTVAGLSDTSIRSYVASAAAGVIGLAGAVSVYTIGGNLSAEGSSSLVARNGNSTSGYVDSRASAAPMLGNFSDATDDPERPGNDTLVSARTRLGNDLPRSAGSASMASVGVPSGTSATIGTGAIVDAGGDLVVAAKGLAQISQLTGSGQASLFGFGGSVSVLDINAPVKAIAGPSTQLSAGGLIAVRASADRNLGAEAYAGSVGGLVGLGAQVAVIHDGSTQSASLDAGVSVLAASRLEVTANDHAITSAKATGGTVGAVTGGASIARITADGSTSATIGANTLLGQFVPQGDPQTLGSLSISASSARDDHAVANAVTAAVVGGAGADAQVKVTPTITARLGDSSRVTAYGSTDITASAALRANSEALGLTFGGLTVGLSFARTELSPIMTSEIGQRAIVRIDGDMLVDTFYNETTDLTSDASQGSGAFAKAIAGSGALIAGSGATSTVVHRPELRSAVRENVFLEAQGDLEVMTVAKSKAIANALGGAVGVIGVGSVSASVDDLPLVFVNLHTGTGLRATGDIRFYAMFSGFANADATAAAGGIVGGAGASAVAVSAPFVHVTRFGTTSVLDPGSAFFFAGHDLSILSQANGSVIANSRGVTAGGVAVGVSDARAEWSPNSDVSLISGTSVVAGLIDQGDVSVKSLVNRTFDGAPLAGGPSANATASAGTALLGGAGATANALARPTASIGLGLSVILRSSVLVPGDVTVMTASGGLAQSVATAAAIGGLFAFGSTTSNATVQTFTGIAAGANTGLLASQSLVVTSRDENDANATSINSGAGFAGIALSNANALVTRQNSIVVRDNVNLTGPVNVVLNATSGNEVNAFSNADGRGFGAGADATATAVLASGGTTVDALIANPALANSRGASNFVEIGKGAKVTGGQITLASFEDGSAANATGRSFTAGAFTNSDAEARAYRLTGTDIYVRQGASLTAPQGQVRIVAMSLSPRSFAQSVATAQQAAGDSDTTAVNFLTSGSFVTAEPGSSITAGTLEVTGATAARPGSPAIDLFTDAVHAGMAIDFGTTTRSPNSSVFSGAVFDATIKLLSTTSPIPELIIAAEGTVTRQNLIEATSPAGDDNFLVRGNFPQLVAPAKFTISTPAVNGVTTGTVFRGRPTVDRSEFAFSDARIVNESTRSLTIGDLVIPANFAVTALVSYPVLAGSTFSPVLTGTAVGGTKLVIDNRGGGEIRIAGNLDNAQGTVEIDSPGGAIRQTGGTIRTRSLTIDSGSIGTSTARLAVNFTPLALGSSTLAGSTSGDAFFSVKTASANGDNPQSLLNFSTGGSLDVSVADGTRIVNGAAATAPTSLFVIGMSVGQSLTITSNQTNISMSDVSVPNGLATVFSNLGSVKGLGTATALRGNMADLRGGAGVGPITTQITALEGYGGNGNFVVTNQGHLRIGGVSAMGGVLAFGAVTITAFGSLRVEEQIQGTTLTLTTSDQATTGQDLVLLALVRATIGAITLNAADSFYALPLQGTVAVTTPSTLTINVDGPLIGNADPGVGSTIFVRAALDALSLVINGGPDNDSLALFRSWSSANNRPSTFNGQGGIDTLLGPDVGTVWVVNAINGGGLASTFSPNFSNVMNFTGVENLTGGAASDTFFFFSGGRVTGVINGGGGSNFMGYSQFGQGVVVDLRNRTATGIDQGFEAIDSITGSQFDDILIGDEGDNFLDGLGGNDILIGMGGSDILTGGDGDDALSGGDGRDILIGGRGNDTLFGDAGDDILVAGLTTYDAVLDIGIRTDRTGLAKLRNFWNDPDTSYRVRIETIVDSLLLNGQDMLPDSTMGDRLSGGSGQDWFIGRNARRTAGEVLGFAMPKARRTPASVVRTTAIPQPVRIDTPSKKATRVAVAPKPPTESRNR
ncbi:hypothetical protein GC170_17055 [bacterium]|nr:hypothetical protein [bacterium]